MPYLSIQQISLSFGKTIALDNVSIDLEKGDYVVVLGPSGAGKTSLLKVIVGLYKPNKGKILVNSKNIVPLNPEERSIAFMPQNYALFGKMDVWGNVSYGPKLQGRNSKEINKICQNILEMVHLENRKDAYPDELSGGMKQRTALARSLATSFPILLLDEPLRALDARLRIELRTELKRIVKNLGFTVLHVTHDQNEAMAVADRIMILNQGKLIQVANQAGIYFNPASVFVASFMDEINHFKGKIIDKTPLGELNIGRGYKEIDKKTIFHNYLIETQIGDNVQAFSEKNFELQEEVDIIIKTESIRVKTHNGNTIKSNSNPETSENSQKEKEKPQRSTVTGKLESKYFLGNWSKLQVKNTKYTWIVKLPSVRAERYQIGDNLHLSYKPMDIIILRRPSAALKGDN